MQKLRLLEKKEEKKVFDDNHSVCQTSAWG
mgnify:CR=1 FL=1